MIVFAIGDEEWPGVSKAIEEMGELGQVLGKLMGSRGKTDHWSGDLLPMLHDEVADVLAALAFLIETNRLDEGPITERARRKLELFRKWHEGDAQKDVPADAWQDGADPHDPF